MTVNEFLAKPVGMDFFEYEKLLKEKHKLEKQIRKANDEFFREEDSLEVLADEVGSERYNKHLAIKKKAEVKKEKAQAKLKMLMEKLNSRTRLERSEK